MCRLSIASCAACVDLKKKKLGLFKRQTQNEMYCGSPSTAPQHDFADL